MSPSVPTPFLFNATPTGWHDGDTGTFTVDRGDRDYSTWTIRLAGCNARELAMPGGVEVRDEVRRRVPPGTPCVLATVAADKYGNRLDAQVFYAGPDGVVHDLVAELAVDGWVALWDGAGKQPIPPWPRTPPAPVSSTERSTVTTPAGVMPTIRGVVADIAERALKTFAQTEVAYYGAGALDILHTDLRTSLSLAAGAAFLSVLSSLASLPIGKGGTASLTAAVVPTAVYEAATHEYGRHAGSVFTQWSTSTNGEVHAGLPAAPEPPVVVAPESVAAPPAYRLGRLPNDPSKPRVRLTALEVPGLAFDPPPKVDWWSKVPAASWGMDGNDKVGDCTCAEVDHCVKTLQVAAGNPEVKSTPAEVLATYSAVTGYTPADRNSDRGAQMQDVRNYWRKHGITLGGVKHTILLFAQVDHTDHALVKWCIARFGEVGLGFAFPDSAMQQFNAGQPWDVIPGQPAPTEGHAVGAVGYDDHYVHVTTWGTVQKMTWAFFDRYVDEAWTQLSEEFVSSTSGDDPLAETAYQLGQQYAAVTGQPNPIPAPSPAPTPPPAPTPHGGFPVAEWEAWKAHPRSVPKARALIVAISAWLAGQ